MADLRLYDNWLEAAFLERPHRFKMRMLYKGKEIEAYVPNTGRLAEFLFPGRKFYLTRQDMPKYDYKVIGTEYQGNYVLLDTIKANRIFQEILEQKVLAEFKNYDELRREVTRGGSKFDFLLRYPDEKENILEIKTCTLCHNGTAMFPDAPTARGQRHLKHLEAQFNDNTENWSIYLIPNSGAERFIPNYHIDFDYGRIFQQTSKVKFKALKLGFADPITMRPELTREIPILFDRIERDCKNKGSYLLVMKNDDHFSSVVGSLGERHFPSGYYVYVGSALRNLRQRVKRHGQVRKKIHWHIDRIVPRPMQLKRTHLIRSSERLEEIIAERLISLADSRIPGFGATDSRAGSHLFYFKQDPSVSAAFSQLILDVRSDI